MLHHQLLRLGRTNLHASVRAITNVQNLAGDPLLPFRVDARQQNVDAFKHRDYPPAGKVANIPELIVVALVTHSS